MPTRRRKRSPPGTRRRALELLEASIVSGLTIAIALRTEGNQRQSQTNRKQSILLRCGRFDARRRSTLICCRRTRISASSCALDLKSEVRTPRISLNRSIIRSRAYPVYLLRYAESNFRYTHDVTLGWMPTADAEANGLSNFAQTRLVRGPNLVPMISARSNAR
jgi:hypothetical protein